jgi:acetylornithine deacetylase/succinyl-diaminopimelate desuccinylase-like protein
VLPGQAGARRQQRFIDEPLIANEKGEVEMLKEALKLAKEGQDQSDADLFEELRIPSISALPEHREDVRRNARWLAERMERLGLATSITDVPGGRHPVLQGDLVVDSKAPTLTIYGHYDVQPADPVDLWISPPFEPTVRDGRVYARGSADNKGNHMAALKAVEFCRQAGGPPINIRFLIEGEEEITGEALGNYVRQNADRLRTDWVLVWDGGFTEDGFPALNVGLRGILYVELEAVGPGIDLHSGGFGGVAPNPLNTLAHILSTLKGRDGRITIPGFYDRVRPPTAQELKDWEKPAEYADRLMQLMQSTAIEGEADYPLIVRQWARPTLDVNGMSGGFTGAGVKTVIASRGMAKVSMRLVPDQDPEEILHSLKAYVAELSTAGVQVEVRKLGATRPVLIDADHAAGVAANEAFEAAFGLKPRLVRSGGSIPVSIDLQEALKAPMIASGLPQADSAAHSPNESYTLDHYHRGIEMLIRFIYALPSGARA